jgi:hypothetical protein
LKKKKKKKGVLKFISRVCKYSGQLLEVSVGGASSSGGGTTSASSGGGTSSASLAGTTSVASEAHNITGIL